MPPQRGGKPRNQAVIDAFQSIFLPNRIVPAVECLHCHRQMASGATRQQTHLDQLNVERTLDRSRDLKKKLRYTQSIEIDKEELLDMEDRLLQEEVAMARLNPSNDEVLEDFLNSIVDGEVAMKHPNN